MKAHKMIVAQQQDHTGKLINVVRYIDERGEQTFELEPVENTEKEEVPLIMDLRGYKGHHRTLFVKKQIPQYCGNPECSVCHKYKVIEEETATIEAIEV